MEEREIERLFREHYLDMYKLAQHYLYNKEECKDIVSDVFANLVHQQARMIPETMRQYLMMSVRNRCINAINQKKLRDKLKHLYAYEELPKSEDPNPSVSDQEEERRHQLHDFINHHLSPQDKDIFRMRFIDEMSYQEMMDVTGISRMAIYKHLSRTINQIKEHFKNKNK